MDKQDRVRTIAPLLYEHSILMPKGLPFEIQNLSDAEVGSLNQTESVAGCEGYTDTVKTKQPWWRRKWWYGWRKGVIISLTCNIVVLIINSSLLIWAKYQDHRSNGIWVVWQGGFDSLPLIDILSHLAINIISTIILTSSNYTLQILLAPTRENIDHAHRKNRSLDIGISSLRNWHHLSWQRKLLYISLFIPTLPIHLLYNSIIFSAIAEFDMNGSGVVTEDFLQKPPSNPLLKNVWSSASKSSASNWTRLATEVCIDAIGPSMMYNYANILFFSNLTTVSQNSSRYYAPYSNPAICDPYNISLDSTQVNKTSSSSPDSWIASFYANSSDGSEMGLFQMPKWNPQVAASSEGLGTDPRVGEEEATREQSTGTSYYYKCVLCTPSSISGFAAPDRDSPYILASIEYCLAKKTYLSKIELIPQLLAILIMCSVVKIVALSVLLLSKFDPLVTIGDAIASFLDNPDLSTRYIGPISVLTLENQNSGMTLKWPSSELLGHDEAWKTPLRHYSDAVPRAWWRWTLILCALYILTIMALAIWTLPQSDIQNAFSGFGTIMWGGVIPISNISLIASILSVNAPQIALSVIYLAYNGLFTSMLLCKEWSDYGKHRKGLRATSPQGKQRSSYFLSLPYRYTIPLAVKSILLHWILSQSMFSVRIDMYKSDLTLKSFQDDYSIGISRPGLIVSAVLVGILLAVPIFLSVRKLDTAMPLVRSNSLAISAACHPATTSSNDERLSLKRLQYGVISEGSSSGKFRVGFSDGEVRPLVPGEVYE